MSECFRVSIRVADLNKYSDLIVAEDSREAAEIGFHRAGISTSVANIVVKDAGGKMTVFTPDQFE